MATTGVFSREIVSDTACNACHERLMFHGGGRRDVQYCVTCHNPGSTDAQSTNTVDFTVMIHKIHRGAELPSVVAGGEYYIVGFGNDKVDYSHIEWPQDIRNCQACHDENDDRTPQAQNWRLNFWAFSRVPHWKTASSAPWRNSASALCSTRPSESRRPSVGPRTT